MKPYYEHGGVVIYHGDGAEVAQSHNGVVVTDPPYNIDYHYNDPSDRRSEQAYNKLAVIASALGRGVYELGAMLFRHGR